MREELRRTDALLENLRQVVEGPQTDMGGFDDAYSGWERSGFKFAKAILDRTPSEKPAEGVIVQILPYAEAHPEWSKFRQGRLEKLVPNERAAWALAKRLVREEKAEEINFITFPNGARKTREIFLAKWDDELGKDRHIWYEKPPAGM